MIETFLKWHGLKFSLDDSQLYADGEWSYFSNEDNSIVIEEEVIPNEVNYTATVYINDYEYVERVFVKGEEEKLIEFITTDKLKLCEENAMNKLKKDFE